MSEFECRFGHLMRPSSIFCEECLDEGHPNEKAIRMDGYSNYELKRMEEEREGWWEDGEEEDDRMRQRGREIEI